MKNYFIIFFLVSLCKITFADDQSLGNYFRMYFDKYEEERKENFISRETIKELEGNLGEIEKNLEILEKEKNNLENINTKLLNIKNIQINRSSAIIILSALLFLIFIILYLSLIISKQRKWRKEYFDKNNNKFIGVLPERIADTIDKSEEAYNSLQESNRKQYDNFNQNLEHVVTLINQVNSSNTENVSQINDQLSALRKFSDEKNELVKKYQEFYDLGKLKSFIFEIIASIDSLENSIQKLNKENKSQSSIEAIERAKERLIILLENENIEVISPDKKLKFNDRKQPIKCKVVDSIETEDETLMGMISLIVHSGYNGRIGENETALIREAWVNVYVKTNKEDNTNG